LSGRRRWRGVVGKPRTAPGGRRVPLALVPAAAADPLARLRVLTRGHALDHLRVAPRPPEVHVETGRKPMRADERARRRSPARTVRPARSRTRSSGPRSPAARRPCRRRRSGSRDGYRLRRAASRRPCAPRRSQDEVRGLRGPGRPATARDRRSRRGTEPARRVTSDLLDEWDGQYISARWRPRCAKPPASRAGILGASGVECSPIPGGLPCPIPLSRSSTRRPEPTPAGRPWRGSARGVEKTTWREYGDAVRQAARALVATGVGPGQGVVILAFKRPSVVANPGRDRAGGAAGRDLHEQHARSVPLPHRPRGGGGGGGGEPGVARAAPWRGGRPGPRRCPHDGEAAGRASVTWADSLARAGRRTTRRSTGGSPPRGRRRGDASSTTSGTTGTPKGVMLTQRNLPSSRTRPGDPAIGAEGPPISYLPLSHIASSRLAPPSLAPAPACTSRRASRAAREPAPRCVRTSSRVPRVWEKIKPGSRRGAQSSPARRRVAAWARAWLAGGCAGPGRPKAAVELRPRRPPRLLEVRHRLGFDAAGARRSPPRRSAKETLDFFRASPCPSWRCTA